MPDYGSRYTDERLNALERRFKEVYARANREVQKKLDAYMMGFHARDKAKQSLVAQGKLSAQEYAEWRYNQTMTGKRWEEMRDILAQEYTDANELAMRALKRQIPDVFAENANYAMYGIENDSQVNTGFTLYDRQTVDRLLRDNPDLVIMPDVDEEKDLKWNKQHIQSAIEQGILQGESIPDIAKRLGYVTKSEKAAATRTARTAMTSAQNGGRIESYNRAKALGINLKKCWLATMDKRVRHEHAALDGQTVDTDKPFKIAGDKIMFPGDPSAPGYLVWNCRCTLISQIEGFERDISKDRFSRLGDMSYSEWKAKASNFEKANQTGIRKKTDDKEENIKQPEPPELKPIYLKRYEEGKKLAEKYDSSEYSYSNALDAAMHYDYDLVEGIFTDTAEYTEKAAFFREQFFKAGFYGDDLEYVAAVRYGEIPEAGRSKNWASGDLEQGVSVIDIVRKKSDYDKSTIYDIQLGLQGIKKYEVHGWYLGRHGADGEPLLLFPEIIREL